MRQWKFRERCKDVCMKKPVNRTFNRTDRVADVIQRELARIIQKEFKDPRVGFLTIVNVEVSKDLAHAKVFVTVFEEIKVEETIHTLNEASGFFRTLLSKSMKLRITPRLRFIYDSSTVYGNHLSSLIDRCVDMDNLNVTVEENFNP